MKAQRLFQVLGLLDEDLIDEAWTYVPEKKASLLRRSPWLRGAAVAACCAVLLLAAFFLAGSIGYYAMFAVVGALFVMAVYYTVKMM